MRILYCTDTWPPQVNGVSVVTALSVAGMRERGWDVAVLAPQYPKTGAQVSTAARDVAVTAIPSLPIPLYPEARLAAPDFPRVLRLVRHFRPDVIHCQTEFMLGRLGLWAGLLTGTPVVTSYHTDFSRYAAAYRMPWLVPAVRMVLRRFHRRSARIFTPSTVARRDLRALGLQAVQVWGRGVDSRRFSPARRDPALRARLGLDDAFTFLYVGRLAPEKDVGVVLDAFARAQAQLPAGAARLVIVGGGPDDAALRAQAPPNTIFVGPQDRESELPAFYASADAFVFASATETLGLVVLEAMASGLPVIAADAGGVSEYLRDGVNGLAAPPRAPDVMAGQMVRLAQDAGLRQRLSDGAIATADALDWDRELDQLDQAYRDVIIAAHDRSTPPPTRPVTSDDEALLILVAAASG